MISEGYEAHGSLFTKNMLKQVHEIYLNQTIFSTKSEERRRTAPVLLKISLFYFPLPAI